MLPRQQGEPSSTPDFYDDVAGVLSRAYYDLGCQHLDNKLTATNREHHALPDRLQAVQQLLAEFAPEPVIAVAQRAARSTSRADITAGHSPPPPAAVDQGPPQDAITHDPPAHATEQKSPLGANGHAPPRDATTQDLPTDAVGQGPALEVTVQELSEDTSAQGPPAEAAGQAAPQDATGSTRVPTAAGVVPSQGETLPADTRASHDLAKLDRLIRGPQDPAAGARLGEVQDTSIAKPKLRIAELLTRLSTGRTDPDIASRLAILSQLRWLPDPSARAEARALLPGLNWCVDALARLDPWHVDDTLEAIFALTVVPDLADRTVQDELSRWATSAPDTVIKALSAAADWADAAEHLAGAFRPALSQRWQLQDAYYAGQSPPAARRPRHRTANPGRPLWPIFPPDLRGARLGSVVTLLLIFMLSLAVLFRW